MMRMLFNMIVIMACMNMTMIMKKTLGGGNRHAQSPHTDVIIDTICPLLDAQQKFICKNPESCGKKRPFVEGSGQKAAAYCFAG